LALKTYEGLFIVDTAGKEEVSIELVNKIQKMIEHVGGRVDKVQRMGIRPFARDTHKRTSGYYVNFVFDAPPTAITELDAKFHLEPEVFRWEISVMPPEPPPRKPRRIPETGIVEK
jgi:small subunit ribosomal protein S6